LATFRLVSFMSKKETGVVSERKDNWL